MYYYYKLKTLMDCIIDYLAVFPDGNNEVLTEGIKKITLIDLAKFIYDINYTYEGNEFKKIDNNKLQELLYILLTEINRRSQIDKDKQIKLSNIEDKENINVNTINKNKGQLSYNAEEYIPYNQQNIMNEIKNNIYSYFTYNMDVDGFTPIICFCNKYNITLLQFIEIVKDDEHIQLVGDKYKSHHPESMKQIRHIIQWTQNNIYKTFNDKNNYYYKFIKNGYLPIDLLMKDQHINKYFSYDTLVLILKEDCRFGLYGRYLRTTI